MESHQFEHSVHLARVILCGVGLVLYVLGMLFSEKILKALHAYFSVKTHPVNLAVIRIVLFHYLLIKSFSLKPIFYSSLPKELLYPPQGLDPIVRLLPIEPAIVWFCGLLLCVSAFMAMIGCCTRLFAWVVVICAVYFMGVSNLYGKVDHNHFVVWFAAILAASPCADVLSVDAVFSRIKKRQQGLSISIPAPSNEYGLPIRFMYLLIGVIYFFPGLWKFYWGGVDWVLSNNLMHYMYSKWFQLNGWLPFFRIDQHEILCRIGAGMTVFFEMSFIILIFSDRWRWLAVVGGIVFHTLTLLLMSIDFTNLLRCYVIFFDWSVLYCWFQRCILKRPMILVDDSKAPKPFLKRSVVWVSIVLLVANIYCGYRGIDSWPFSIFPTFASVMYEPQDTVVDIVMFDERGSMITLDRAPLLDQFGISDFWGLMQRILMERDRSVMAQKVSALLAVAAREQPEIYNVKIIKMYRSIYSVLPSDFGKAPLHKELVLDVNVQKI